MVLLSATACSRPTSACANAPGGCRVRGHGSPPGDGSCGSRPGGHPRPAGTAAHRVRRGGAGLGVPLLLVTQVGVWWWTQHLLLAARVPWLPLLPGALLTGVALTTLSVVAKLYVPSALNRGLDRYGSPGAASRCCHG